MKCPSDGGVERLRGLSPRPCDQWGSNLYVSAAAHVPHSTGVEQADLEIKVEASLMETGPRNAHPFHTDGPHQPLILF